MKAGASGGGKDDLAGRLDRKEALHRESRSAEAGKGLSWIGTIGIIGWCVTLPMLAGIALGRWLDAKLADGRSYTVMLLVGGLLLGCGVASGWVRRRLGLAGWNSPDPPGARRGKEGGGGHGGGDRKGTGRTAP